MKNFKIASFVLVVCFLILAVNARQINNPKLDIGLFEIKNAFAQNESGTGPEYEKCGKDDCEVSYSIGIYTVTEHGHYWHCQSTYDEGTCISSQCDVKCDAI